MPGTTPLYGLTYPIGGDRLDAAVSTIPQQLAEDVESALAGFGGIAAPGSWTAFPNAVGSNVGSGYRAMEYRKVGVEVTLRGVMGGLGGGLSAGTVLGTLPSGFRPTATDGFTVRGGTTANAVAAIDVETNGVVRLISALAAGATLWLSPIKFAID